jgi:hypothetical protein
MAHYILEQHIEKVCTPNLNDDCITYCGTCPFEDQVLEAAPHLSLNFKMKRRMIKESHEREREM